MKLESLEASSVYAISYTSIHSNVKVVFTAIRGKIFDYYELRGTWKKCSKQRAKLLLEK
jgi:hypothetical protein